MCSLVGGYQLLKERTASIFRAEVHNIQFLWNTGNYPQKCTA
jgi:hypothetical protein